MAILSSIIGAVFNIGSMATSMAAANIDDEIGDNQIRTNDMYGDITNAGYLPGASGGFQSDIQHNFYTFAPLKKQRLQKASMWMSGIGSSFGGMAAAFDGAGSRKENSGLPDWQAPQDSDKGIYKE